MRLAGLFGPGLILLFTSVAAWGQADPSPATILQGLRPTKQDVAGPERGGGIVPALTETDTLPDGGARAPAAKASGHSIRAAPGERAIWLAIDFVTGSAELTPHAARQLDTLGRALASPGLANDHFRIEGHTDTVGTAVYNKGLSVRRAQAVADYLERHAGVASARLVPVGLGVSGLLVPTPDQTPELRNRRVRIVNLDS